MIHTEPTSTSTSESDSTQKTGLGSISYHHFIQWRRRQAVCAKILLQRMS